MVTRDQALARDIARLVEQPPSTRAETKRERFKRICQFRMGVCVKHLRNLQQLGNREVYEFTDADRRKIVDALLTEVQHIDYAFSHGTAIVPVIVFD